MSSNDRRLSATVTASTGAHGGRPYTSIIILGRMKGDRSLCLCDRSPVSSGGGPLAVHSRPSFIAPPSLVSSKRILISVESI